MKKFAIACAVVMATALSLTSCGDTQYCYEVTTTYNDLRGETHTKTYYEWCTKNELDARKETIKQALIDLKMDEKTIEISAKKTSKSKSDCYK